MAIEVNPKDKEKIIALITALAPHVKIYLFGSRARGTNDEWADIDLALDAGEPLPRTLIGELNSIMQASNTPYKVDILDFHFVTPQMKESIIRDCVVWKT